MHEITFNGVKSSTLGIRIERSPEIIIPRRKFDVISVPGRNGDYVIMQDAWENYIQPYDIFFGNGTAGSAESTAHAVAAWLHSANDYAQLEDTYEPTYFRQAYYVDETNIVNALSAFGRTTIRFNCRPEKFLYTGAAYILMFSSGGTVTNPTIYTSRPLIRINGSGNGTFSITSPSKTYTVSITGISSYIMLNSDTQNAYKFDGTNLNGNVTITSGGEFPRFAPGNSTVTWTGGISNIEYAPRWFEL